MSTTNTDRPSAFVGIPTVTAILVIITAARILLCAFTSIDVQNVGAAIAACCVAVLGLLVVSAAPKAFRTQRDPWFNWVVGIAMAGNIVSHLIWGISLI